ncbi:MAG: LysM peptidoglycan-binding domain-containing protein [Candidatus Methylomirabilis sp.]|nr:LysM peptidoglycan-binding domain-containing protein [Candidatus Methylomirabilis sp.]
MSNWIASIVRDVDTYFFTLGAQEAVVLGLLTVALVSLCAAFVLVRRRLHGATLHAEPASVETCREATPAAADLAAAQAELRELVREFSALAAQVLRTADRYQALPQRPEAGGGPATPRPGPQPCRSGSGDRDDDGGGGAADESSEGEGVDAPSPGDGLGRGGWSDGEHEPRSRHERRRFGRGEREWTSGGLLSAMRGRKVRSGMPVGPTASSLESSRSRFPHLLTEAGARMDETANGRDVATATDARTIRIVRPGDTLSHMVQAALRESGASADVEILYRTVGIVARANRLTDPDRIRPGQAIDFSAVLSGTRGSRRDIGLHRHAAVAEASIPPPASCTA